jgi:predicted phosphodiesterase
MSCYPKGKEPQCGTCGRNKIRERNSAQCVQCHKSPGWHLDGDSTQIARGYESAWLEWQRFIGQAKDRYAGPPKRPVRVGRQKIVVAGDFHIPFHDRAAVASLFEREKDADLLIINGDLQDFYSISRFTKYEHIPIDQELAEVTLFLEQASQTWPRVLITTGNHDVPRFERQLRERLDENVVKVVEFLAGGNLSPIAAIARRFPNVEIASVKAGKHTVSWMAQVNDLIVTHAEKFSRVPGSTLRGIEEWLADSHDTLGLQPWRVLVQAHTHQLGIFPWHADKLLVEGACMCMTHGYQLSAKIGGRPQRRGYVTLEQIDGVTDLNSVRMRWLDAEAAVA